jgi:hypothetical protein
MSADLESKSHRDAEAILKYKPSSSNKAYLALYVVLAALLGAALSAFVVVWIVISHDVNLDKAREAKLPDPSFPAAPAIVPAVPAPKPNSSPATSGEKKTAEAPFNTIGLSTFARPGFNLPLFPSQTVKLGDSNLAPIDFGISGTADKTSLDGPAPDEATPIVKPETPPTTSPVEGQPKSKYLDASEGTPIDPLLDTTYDLNHAQTIPTELVPKGSASADEKVVSAKVRVAKKPAVKKPAVKNAANPSPTPPPPDPE